MADYNVSLGADTSAAVPSVSALEKRLLAVGRAADSIITKLQNVATVAASTATAAAESLRRISSATTSATSTAASGGSAAAANAAATATRNQAAASAASAAAAKSQAQAENQVAAATRQATAAAVANTTATNTQAQSVGRQTTIRRANSTASQENTAALTANTAAMNSLSAAVLQLGSNVDGLTNKQRTNSAEQSRFSKILGSVKATVVGLVLSYVGLNAAMSEVSAIKNASLQMAGFDRTAKFVSGSAHAGAEEMAFLRRESDRLGLVLPTIAQEYFNLAAATKGTKIEGQATRDIFLGVAEAATVLGLSQERTKLVMQGVGQIATKQVVSMEELRQQIGENLPIALGSAARAYGVTTKRMTEMIASGEVLFSDFLPKWAAQMRRDVADGVAEAVTSAQANFARLENSAFELRAAYGDALVPALIEFQKALVEAFQDESVKELIVTVGTGAVKAFELLVGILAFASKHMDALVIVATAFLLLQLPTAIGSVTLSLGLMATATTTASAAFARLNAIMAANPFIVVLGALLLFNEAIKISASNSEQAIRAMVSDTEKLQEGWRKTEEAIRSADEAQVEMRKRSLSDELSKVTAEIERLQALTEGPIRPHEATPLSSLPGAAKKVSNDDLLEMNKVKEALGQQIALRKQLESQIESLTKTQAKGAEGEEDYGKKVQALVDRLSAKKAGLEATREELGILGEPMANAAADAASLGRAIESLSKLGVNKDSAAGKQIIELETAIGRMNAQVKAFSKGPGISEKLDDQTDSLLAAAKAYRITVEAGDDAIEMMREEISVRRQAKTSNAEIIKGLMDQVRAKKEAEKFVAGEKQIAVTKRSITEINRVTNAYKISIQAGRDMERQLEQERISRERVAAAAAEQKEEVDALTRSEFAAIESSKAQILKADLDLEQADLEELIRTLRETPQAYEQVVHAQEQKAEKSALLADLSVTERQAIEPLIDKLFKLRDAYSAASEIKNEQQNLDILEAQANVRREDFITFEAYKAKLEEVTFEMELQARLRTMVGTDPGQLAELERILRKQREINKTLEAKNVETAWQAAISSIGETLEQELTSSAQTAIEGWVEFGNSWIANLGEKLVEMFLSQAVQAAAAALFDQSGGGGGFWSSVLGAFSGGSGGGGGGGGGIGTWISAIGSAWKAYQTGGKFWSSLAGGFGGQPALTGAGTWTGVGGGQAFSVSTPTLSSTGQAGAGGLSAGATSLAVAGLGAAIIYGLNTWLDGLRKDEFRGVGETFWFGEKTDLSRPPTPVGGSNPPPPGGSPSGGGNGGMTSKPAKSGSGVLEINPTKMGILSAGFFDSKVGTEAVEALKAQIENATVGLVGKFGGVVTALGKFSINVDNEGKHFKVVTTNAGVEVEKIFDTWEEAIDHGITSMLAAGSFEGLTKNIETVLKKANSLGLEGLDEALALAAEADAALAKKTGGVADSVSLFERQTGELRASLEPMLAKMRELGLTSESIAAWEELRIQQLKDQQAIQGGESFTQLFASLAQVSAAAAGDLGLVAQYEQALGDIRIAQLRMQADELRALGYLTAETMNLLDQYIGRLQSGEVGQVITSGGGYFGGGGGGFSAPDNSAQEEANRQKAIEEFRREANMARLALSGLSDGALEMIESFRGIDDAVASARELGIAEDELAAYRRDQVDLLKQDLLRDDQRTVRRARAGDFALEFDDLVKETQGKFEAAVQIAMDEAARLGTTWQEQFAAMGDVISEAATKNFTDLITQGLETDDPAALRQIVDLLNNLGSLEIPYGVRQAIEAIPDLGERVKAAMDRVREGIMDSVREYLDAAQGIGEHQRQLLDLNKTFADARKGIGQLYGVEQEDPLTEALRGTEEQIGSSLIEPLERLQDVLRKTGDSVEDLASRLAGEGGLGPTASGVEDVIGGAAGSLADLIDTTGDYERAMAELEAAQRLATQQIGISFLGSLKELGLNLPADEVRALAEAEFNLAKVRAISSLLALQEAGAFEGLNVDIARILSDLTNLTFTQSTYNPDNQQQGGGGGGDSGSTLQDEIADTRKMLADLIKEWREKGIAQVILDARRMREEYDEALDAANKYRLATRDLTDAYQHAVRVFVNDQLRPYEEAGINRTVLGLRDLVDHFDDLNEAFRTAGASSSDMARLARARVMALDDFWREATQPLRDILADMQANDPRTTNEQKFLSAQSRFRDLAARAAAGDVGALEELTAATNEYRSQANLFLGQGGGSLRIFDEITDVLKGITGFNPLTGDNLPDKIDRTNEILADILTALGGPTKPKPPANDTGKPLSNSSARRPRMANPANPSDGPIVVGTGNTEAAQPPPPVRPLPPVDVGLGSRVNSIPTTNDAGQEDRRLELLDRGLKDLKDAQMRGSQQVAATTAAGGASMDQLVHLVAQLLAETQSMRRELENNSPRAGR